MNELEDLFDYLMHNKEQLTTTLFHKMEDLTAFKLGQYKGQIMSLENIIEYVRCRIDYADSPELK